MLGLEDLDNWIRIKFMIEHNPKPTILILISLSTKPNILILVLNLILRPNPNIITTPN